MAGGGGHLESGVFEKRWVEQQLANLSLITNAAYQPIQPHLMVRDGHGGWVGLARELQLRMQAAELHHHNRIHNPGYINQREQPLSLSNDAR